MHKWKRVMSAMLTSAMVISSGLVFVPAQVQAAESTAVSGKIYDIYKAFEGDTENKTNNWVDTEFGEGWNGTLNSSLSPRVLELKYQSNEEDNGKMLATFECNRLPKTDAALVAERQNNGDNINENLSAFPIYESIDQGATWGAGETEMPARGGNYVPVGYVQNQKAETGTAGMRNCPQLYEMPETIGNLEKGTILCAGNSIEVGLNGSGASVGDSSKTNMELCVSDDIGRTWTHHSTIVGPIDGKCALNNNTLWEPFFLTFDNKLYCFYSDEAFDDTTDQDISYVYYDGTNWSDKQVVVRTEGARPGMPIISQLEDGRFMLTFEVDGGSASGYILSAENDLSQWYAKDGSLKATVSKDDAVVLDWNNGSPYNITTSNGTILYNYASDSVIKMSSNKAPDVEDNFWIVFHTGLNAAYNREILQLSSGNIMIAAGWNNKGIQCVTWDYEMDLEKTGALESKIKFNNNPVYMAYNGTPMFTWSGVNGHAEPNQFYEFREVEENVYMMISTNNGKAAVAEPGNEGSKVNTADINTNDQKQQWEFEAVDGKDGWYRVRNAASDLYLTSPRTAESDKRDMQLTLEEKQDTDSQLWKPGAAVKDSGSQEQTEKYTVELIYSDGVDIAADAEKVKKGGTVNITVTPRQGCKSIDKVFINNEEQGITTNEDGSITLVIENVSSNLEVCAETTLEDWYVSVPANDYPGRNQCLSPRVVEGLNGELYCTFESGVPSAAADGEYTFPIYKSENKGKNWVKVGEVINDDAVHPDEYYKVTYNGNVPKSAEKVNEGDEGAVLHTWNMQCCPQLFVLPEDLGQLKKGTLLCAGMAVTLEKDAKKVADVGYGGLWDSTLDFYYSEDGGVTWKFLNTIAEGGENPRNIMGYDPVWEPYFVFYNQELICYYSDETDNTYPGSQKLVHKIMGSNNQWSESTIDVEQGGARPGMPIVTQLENGKWMMVYEGVGMTNPIKSLYKISDDPYNWNPSDKGEILPEVNGTFGGSPYVYTLADGRIVAGTGSLSEVLINTKNDGTGTWIPYITDAPAGYNRCFLQLSSGEFLIVGTEGSGFAGKDNSIYVKSLNPDELKVDEIDSRVQHIKNKANVEVIGIWQGSAESGAEAVTWQQQENIKNQMWIPQLLDDGSYLLVNYNSNKVLTAKEDATLMQSDVVEQGSETQRFLIEKTDEEGYYTMKNQSNGKYLGSAAEHKLTFADSADTDSQLWSFGKAVENGKDFVPQGKENVMISAHSSEGGSISPSDEVTIEKGQGHTFTFTPNDGYKLTDVTVNNISVITSVTVDEGGTGTYSLDTINEDISV